MTLPNLFFIGGMRFGSTTLYLLLAQHPEIFMADIKEPMFWYAEALRQKGLPLEGRVNGRFLTRDAYDGLFAGAGAVKWAGEASHYIYHPEVCDLIRRHSPDARILISVRDPAQRMFSEYLFRLRSGYFRGSFEDFITQGARFDAERGLVDVSRKSRLGKGLQANLLQRWIEVFGMERIHVINFDDLKARPAEVTRQLYHFLEVDPGFTPAIVHTQRGGVPRSALVMRLLNLPKVRIRRFVPRLLRERLRAQIYSKVLESPKVAPGTWEALRRYYASDIARLQALTGLDLRSWILRPAPGG
ncbi:sulfotransferase family protein [Leisingera sp.]|uniref:sulfotransferase family protein n=1 Tax=Leisingera sp. TaxID=1879318 RepID=UPI003A8F61AF